jgi:hypothetical protein
MRGTTDHPTLHLHGLALELPDHEVDRGQRVGSGGVGSHDETVSEHGHLADLAVGDAGIVLLGEVDLGTFEHGKQSADMTDLLLHLGTHPTRNFSPTVDDGYVHTCLLVRLPRLLFVETSVTHLVRPARRGQRRRAQGAPRATPFCRSPAARPDNPLRVVGIGDPVEKYVGCTRLTWSLTPHSPAAGMAARDRWPDRGRGAIGPPPVRSAPDDTVIGTLLPFSG